MPAREVERREPDPARRARARRSPVEAAGDHQVDDDEELALEREDDALAQAAEPHDGPALDLGHRRIDRAEDERARQAEPLERRPRTRGSRAVRYATTSGSSGNCPRLAWVRETS